MKSICVALFPLAIVFAQNPQPKSGQLEPVATFKATSVARTAKAINYRHRSGSTKVDFKGTALMPQARGEAQVESKQGRIEIDVNFRDLERATKFGSEYLTYVLWAITPEGRPVNLGEVLLNGNKSRLAVTSELQVFGMIVTAEPYFAVTMPSDLVVMENEVRRDTAGKIQEIDAKYELLQRGQYEKLANPLSLTPDPKIPLELFEARNAIQIAKSVGAAKYAADTLKKAEDSLRQADSYFSRKQTKPSIMIAREAVQTAEDARALAVRRAEDERLETERREAEERTRRAKAQAEDEQRRREQAEAERRAEAQRRAKAEEDRVRAEAARAEAERKTLQAELEASRAAIKKAEAETATANARLMEEQARKAAAESERARQQAEAEKQALRARLLQQFNSVLETRDTERGLIVNMGDILFDVGKATLKPAAREKLARLAGLCLAYPGLRLSSEGHTDNVGGEDMNQKLSEKRAEAVRSYLVEQGIPDANINSVGMGMTLPIASNDTAQGRQRNRRVELIVSGEIIGTSVAAARTIAQ